MFVSSTGAELVSHWLYGDATKKYQYSFDLLTRAIFLFYIYATAVPVLLYAITTYVLKYAEAFVLTKVMSVYGYSNILWVPVMIANFLLLVFVNNKSHHLLLNLLGWLVVGAGGVVTGLSIIFKIGPVAKKNSLLLANGDEKKARSLQSSVILSMIVAHVSFVVLVKTLLFRYNA